MNKLMTSKRGIIIFLVIATVLVFVGIVWYILVYSPWGLGRSANTIDTPRPNLAIRNCTYPLTFWMEHTEYYPSQIAIGNSVYQAADIHQVLSSKEQGITSQLEAQLIGVFLNSTSGADQGSIEGDIFQAYGWIAKHPDDRGLSDDEREEGVRMFNRLEAYNLGLAGVAPCLGAGVNTSTATSTPSATATGFLTSTASQTSTSTPSMTATQTNTATVPGFTYVAPTRTPSPTKESTRGPEPTAPPAPSDTPEPPTQEPVPTNTVGLPTLPTEPPTPPP